MTARIDFTDEQKDRAVDLARIGASTEHIAHAFGISRKHFHAIRKREPEFGARILAALAAYATELQERIATATDPAEAKMWQDIQSRRFPQQYGADPRFRKQADLDDERHSEDVESGEAAATGTAKLAEAIDAFLAEREGPKCQ